MLPSVVNVVVDTLCMLVGVAILVNYRGTASHFASVIAGRTHKPQPDDRFWSILPFSLGLGQALVVFVQHISTTAALIVGLSSIGVYFLATMRLGWLYTPADRRQIGPLFWTMRAVAIPVLGFLGFGALMLLAGIVQ